MQYIYKCPIADISKNQILSPKGQEQDKDVSQSTVPHCPGPCSFNREKERKKRHKWWKKDDNLIVSIKQSKESHKETNSTNKRLWHGHRTQPMKHATHTHAHKVNGPLGNKIFKIPLTMTFRKHESTRNKHNTYVRKCLSWKLENITDRWAKTNTKLRINLDLS